MRIGIDARELTGQPTGVGRVVSGLLEAWPQDDEIILYAREPLPWPVISEKHRSRVVPGPRRMPGALWEQVVLPRLLREDGVEALFSPAYGMPRRPPCPVVVGMHDCACEATPWEFGWRERLRRRWAGRHAGRRADYLLVGSRFSAAEIGRWYGVGAERIVTARYGVGRNFRHIDPAAVAAARQRYGITGRSVLFVGAPLGRRNLAGLADAIRKLRLERPDVGLYVVGPQRGNSRGVDAEGLTWLGYVPEDDLPALYAAATVAAYPSSYEGFGFPVLEALACGTPVVASKAGSLDEVFAGKAWLVDDTPAQWTTALATLLDDDATRREWTEDGQRWALRRHWGPAARLLRGVLKMAAGRAKQP